MRITILLYTTDPGAATKSSLEQCIGELDFAPALKVSRTIGPQNYYERTKRSLEEDGTFTSPPQDMNRKPFDSIARVSELLRPNSVLSIYYSSARSERLKKIGDDISAISNGGFFWSEARFNFGPADVIAETEDDDGDLDVELIDVAHFSFALTCDNYLPNLRILRDGLGNAPAFELFRADLEKNVGPLKLRID